MGFRKLLCLEFSRTFGQGFKSVVGHFHVFQPESYGNCCVFVWATVSNVVRFQCIQCSSLCLNTLVPTFFTATNFKFSNSEIDLVTLNLWLPSSMNWTAVVSFPFGPRTTTVAVFTIRSTTRFYRKLRPLHLKWRYFNWLFFVWNVSVVGRRKLSDEWLDTFCNGSFLGMVSCRSRKYPTRLFCLSKTWIWNWIFSCRVNGAAISVMVFTRENVPNLQRWASIKSLGFA